MTRLYQIIGQFACLAVIFMNSLCSAQSGNLLVGAAKIDITPTNLAGLTGNPERQFTGVHDNI